MKRLSPIAHSGDAIAETSGRRRQLSQGVCRMEDSAMNIRVEFMTRPGDQFNAGNKVHSRIRDLFAQIGTVETAASS